MTFRTEVPNKMKFYCHSIRDCQLNEMLHKTGTCHKSDVVIQSRIATFGIRLLVQGVLAFGGDGSN